MIPGAAELRPELPATLPPNVALPARLIPPLLGTPRLWLRWPRESDWRALHAYYGDEDSTRYTTRRVFTEAETWRAVAGMLGHWGFRGYGPYVLESRRDGQVLGMVGYWYPNDWPEPEVLWSLVPAARGQGYATEAARAVLAMLQVHVGGKPPISLIDVNNAPSQRVAQALGAELESVIDFRGTPAEVYRHARATEPPVRRASAADAAAIAQIYLASRRAHVPYAPLRHADDEVRRHLTEVVLPSCTVWVSEHAAAPAGFIALRPAGADDPTSAHWIEHLYVHPSRVGRGHGRALLAQAVRSGARPLRLHTFAQNQGARRFYERLGFMPIAFGDGSGNEERCADVLYELA